MVSMNTGGGGSGGITVAGTVDVSDRIGRLLGHASLDAGENHVGQVGGETVIVAQTPTITAGLYAAKDAVGGLLTFANAVRVVGGSGVLHAVTIIDDGNQSAELVLVLFNQTFTNTADNAPFDPSDADLENCIGIVKVGGSDYQSFNDNAVGCVRSVGLPIELVGTSLFGQLMCTGAPTYVATTDLTIKLHILQD